MLVQAKAYLLLLMCLSMPCPVKMAALEQAVRPPEQAMAYLNIRLKIRAIHYGLASRIAQVVDRELLVSCRIVIFMDTVAVMAALMAATAIQGEVRKCTNPLLAMAAVTVAALAVRGPTLLLTVEMRHIMVRVPAVAAILEVTVVL